MRRAHGIGGDVVVRGLVSDAAERFVEGATLRTGESSPRELVVQDAKPHKGDYIVTLERVQTRDDAEGLVGVQFVMPVDERRALGDNEWWPEDLIGCDVVDLDSEPIGTVVDVEVGAAQDRLVVETPDGTRFEVPLVDPLVPSVSPEESLIVVDLPEGLLDI